MYFLFSAVPLFSLYAVPVQPGPLVQDMSILRASYPDLRLSASYDTVAGDWLISVTTWYDAGKLYWAGGRFLTQAQAARKADYWLLVYEYSTRTPDPSQFTPLQIEAARKAGSDDVRQHGAVQGTAFFDIVYDCATQPHVERHLKKVLFLGKPLTVHEQIVPALARVEERIRSLEMQDRECAAFVKNIGSMGGYHWRDIRDSPARSFHSMGLAVDILPKAAGGKTIYWQWEKAKPNRNWMLVSLKNRWTPPEKILEAFYSEGFIWGGNWILWDNMHFEYRPELLVGHNRHYFKDIPGVVSLQ
jgi:hypothetical protein